MTLCHCVLLQLTASATKSANARTFAANAAKGRARKAVRSFPCRSARRALGLPRILDGEAADRRSVEPLATLRPGRQAKRPPEVDLARTLKPGWNSQRRPLRGRRRLAVATLPHATKPNCRSAFTNGALCRLADLLQMLLARLLMTVADTGKRSASARRSRG